MTVNRCERSRRAARAGHALRLFAALALAAALAWYSSQVSLSRDVTRARAHTLSHASIAILETFDTPITITAYLPPTSAQRERVGQLVGRYRRHRPAITLEYIDPASDPERVRTDEIRDGELLIQSDGRTERTTVYSEQALTEALARLARAADSWVVFVTGHGERSPRRGANHDVSDWANVLEKRGFHVQEINLSEVRAVPDNTSVLVIASPRLDYQPSETDAVMTYLERGGNLLWFAEPDTPAGFKPLERAVGFERIPGTIVDPVSLAHGVDNPAFVLLNRYADLLATKGFNYTTVMFYATGLREQTPPGWESNELIHSGDKAWSETEALAGNVDYDGTADHLGPLPVTLTLTRKLPEREQRVVVAGDGDFLANTYLQNSGNQDLGVRFVEWLASNDTLVAVPSRAAEDNALALEDWHKAVIGFAFLLGLPGAFAFNGILIWWRRRRA